MTGLVSLFYTDASGDFQAPSGLETLARYPTVVLQAEMATAVQDSQGRAYAADGMTPVGWLTAEDVDCWLYVNVSWAKDSKEYGGPGEVWRRAQSLLIEQADAWLHKALNGGRVPVYGGKMWAVDVRNLRYQDWLRQNAPGKRLFVDCGFYHAASHHGWVGGPDADRANIVKDIYAAWRQQGARLMVNAGWEALDPEKRPAVYPFADVVDGVAVEVPGGQNGPDGYRDLVSYRNVRQPDLTRLERLVKDWLGMGKEVWLIARWQRSQPADYTYSPWPTFEEHADFWLSAAQDMGCSVSVFGDTSHAEWRENWTAEWGRTEDGDQKTDRERIADCEVRIAELAKQVAALTTRLDEVTWSFQLNS